MPTELKLLCAGAAKGLVHALAPRLRDETGATVGGRFGAVGAMKEALLAGEPCDLMVTTETMARELEAEGRLRAGSLVPLGRVRTGVAVRRGTPPPDVCSRAALAAALAAADALFVPDTVRSTAGQHVARVLDALGLRDALAPRLREYPNGATAMAELAACDAASPIGITQVTEILYTEGATLVAPLPAEFELATVYVAAVAAGAASPELAARFIAMLAGEAAAALRAEAGFEA
jgi:molybdate transport system substrate-binding protein